MAKTLVSALLIACDEAYDKRSWHGTNLRGSLRGVDHHAAAARPAEGRHNIWELALHAAYWKYTVVRRITGAARGSFPLDGSNFFARPEGTPDANAWRRDLAILAEQHRALRTAIADLDDRDLARRVGKESVARLVRGVIAHDLYHAGQIQLIKRLTGG